MTAGEPATAGPTLDQLFPGPMGRVWLTRVALRLRDPGVLQRPTNEPLSQDDVERLTRARTPSADRLERELRARFDGLVVGEERWSSAVTVIRMLVQFRFEVRVGERAGEVVLMHRVTAPEGVRADDRDSVEAALTRAWGVA